MRKSSFLEFIHKLKRIAVSRLEEVGTLPLPSSSLAGIHVTLYIVNGFVRNNKKELERKKRGWAFQSVVLY